MKKLEELRSYEIVNRRWIADLQSEGILMRHKRTGARVALLSNDDDNKVFYIGFRTPVDNSKGTPHILEHSVLCGSDKYPIKDPFVELAKGSLNTFLNAMTFSDKTLYPLASVNDKDFQNLMDVYLDAVFHPNIYKNEKIFMQEGWHYELDAEDEPLRINGVVYNEMKGVNSSPEEVLELLQMTSLYPDNTYGQNSGGEPKDIPDLTYPEFLEYHKKYYHPSNAYIYLYGNLDMAEKLDYIDREYLSDYDRLDVDSRIKMQEPFASMQTVVKEFAVDRDADLAESGYLSYGAAVGDSLDRELNIAFQIIDYALCSAPGAPLKEALTHKKLGKDVYSNYSSGVLQPYFCIVSSNCDVTRREEFLTTVTETLKETCQNGFQKKALLAGINHYEFKYREADFGSYPKGLMYGLQVMDSWLYDEEQPFLHIEANETFAKMKELAQTDYFEKLVEQYLLNNPHSSLVVMQPVKGLDTAEEENARQQMEEKKNAMPRIMLQSVMETYRDLTAFQEAEDSKENLAKIPMLRRTDLSPKARQIVLSERNAAGKKVLVHPMYTNGIAYVRMIFGLENVPADLFPYIGILRGCLGIMNTGHYTYGELCNEIDLTTGGMTDTVNVYGSILDPDDYQATFEMKTKVLYEQLPKAMDLFYEMMTTTRFEEDRLLEVLEEAHAKMQSQMIGGGHAVAINRAFSYGSKMGEMNEVISGIPYYQLLTSLLKNYEKEKTTLIEKLTELCRLIFCRENLEADYIGEEEHYADFVTAFTDFAKKLPEKQERYGTYEPTVSRKNEGFYTAGQVQYVCRVGNFRRAGLPYTGALRFLKVMMEYQYLWENIRVKGGAYGCMCGFGKSGDMYLVSYRDPHLRRTLQVYADAAQKIREFTADERTMDQYIVGAVGDLDTPMNPAALGLFSMVCYRNGVTQEDLDRERKELLAVTQADIRELAKYVEELLSQEQLCVVGTNQKIKEAESLFGTTLSLI